MMIEPHGFVFLAWSQVGWTFMMAGFYGLDVFTVFSALLTLGFVVTVLYPWGLWLLKRKQSADGFGPNMLVDVERRPTRDVAGRLVEHPTRRARLLWRPLLHGAPPFLVVCAEVKWLVEYLDTGERQIAYQGSFVPLDAVTQLGGIVD